MDNHGGNIYNKNIKYDFSVNVNPLGMPLMAKKAIINNLFECERYPDTNCTELKKAIAEYENSNNKYSVAYNISEENNSEIRDKKNNITEDNIVCGNGAIDIIYKTISVIRPEKILIAIPCFSEYEKAARECGAEISYYVRKENDGKYSIEEDFVNMIKGHDMVILCQPNNPTGDIINKALMEKIIEKINVEKSFLLMDECFMDFVVYQAKNSLINYTNKYDRLLIVKAFTKYFSMAGLRLGYGISGDKDLISKISKFGPEWNVSAIANIAGIAVLNEINNKADYKRETEKLIETEKKYLTEELTSIGLIVYKTYANFLLIYSELDLYDELIKNEILIRDCSNFIGLRKGFYRIAIRNHNENKYLINELRKVVL